MASHTHSGASCGINRNHLGYVHKFCILNIDKTALNTSLDNVYCWAKIKIAYNIVRGVGPPRVTLLWGRNYWVYIGCIEIKVGIMSGHYSQL
jgi:hypothetical protein